MIDVQSQAIFKAPQKALSSSYEYSNVILDGLLHSTIYNIFCYSKTIDGKTMDVNSIMKTKLVVQIPCCLSLYLLVLSI
jgi:hypothetical protein